jgi:hypothetical protein
MRGNEQIAKLSFPCGRLLCQLPLLISTNVRPMGDSGRQVTLIRNYSTYPASFGVDENRALEVFDTVAFRVHMGENHVASHTANLTGPSIVPATYFLHAP